jgi:NPCBM/NEW2 domain
MGRYNYSTVQTTFLVSLVCGVLVLSGQHYEATARGPDSAAAATRKPTRTPSPTATSAPTANEIDLAALSWASATNGFGEVHVGTNAAGGTCKLNGIAYSSCLGLHADAELIYAISGMTRFMARVGLDDNVNDPVICDVAGHYYQTASVRFKIYGDDQLLYDSGDLNKDDRARDVDVAVPASAKTLRIVVDNVDGKITCDTADIGDGLLSASGAGASTPAPTRTPSPTRTTTPTQTPTRIPVSTSVPSVNVGYKMYVPLVEVSEGGDGTGLP